MGIKQGVQCRAQYACLQALHCAVHVHEALAAWLELLQSLAAHLLAAVLWGISGGRRRVRGRIKQSTGKPPPPLRALAVVVAETDACDATVERVVELVRLCTGAGITDVSVYDPAGASLPGSVAMGARVPLPL
jgi:hypothetical protein